MNNDVVKALRSGIFPSAKNKVWTMCQCALEMSTLAMEEAEKNGLVNDQFYLAFEDALNLISVKDHTNNDNSEFGKELENFYADSEN